MTKWFEIAGRLLAQPVTKSIDDIVNAMPWVDVLTATAIMQIRKTLLEAPIEKRKELLDSILTGFCKSCLHVADECTCKRSKSRALKR